MSRLNGKQAVITGGTTGIGFATARRFLAEGAQVIVTGQNPERVARAQEQLGAGAVAIVADVTRQEDRERLVAEVNRRFGGLDILFLNAGVARFAPLEQADETFFDRQFDVNVRGAFFTVRSLSPLLRQGASVLFNASTVHGKGLPGAHVYAATKAAVRSLVRSLAAELAGRGIRVNSLSPGYVPTEIQGKLGLPTDALADFESGVTAKTPLGRVGSVEELASAATFLASADSSYVTAADLKVDGGFASV